MAQRVNINLPPMPQIEIKIEGQWVKAEHVTGGLSLAIERGYQKGLDSVARKIIWRVKRAINSGLPPEGSGVRWAPLSPSTIAKYGPHEIYRLTGVYYRSLSIQRQKNRVFIGIPHGAQPSGESKLTLNEVAKVLEYGSRDGRIPARPLWAPALISYGGPTQIKKEIIKQIRSQLFRDFGINSAKIRSQ